MCICPIVSRGDCYFWTLQSFHLLLYFVHQSWDEGLMNIILLGLSSRISLYTVFICGSLLLLINSKKKHLWPLKVLSSACNTVNVISRGFYLGSTSLWSLKSIGSVFNDRVLPSVCKGRSLGNSQKYLQDFLGPLWPMTPFENAYPLKPIFSIVYWRWASQ